MAYLFQGCAELLKRLDLAIIVIVLKNARLFDSKLVAKDGLASLREYIKIKEMIQQSIQVHIMQHVRLP